MNPTRFPLSLSHLAGAAIIVLALAATLLACTAQPSASSQSESEEIVTEEPYDITSTLEGSDATIEEGESPETPEDAAARQETAVVSSSTNAGTSANTSAETLRKELAITEDFRDSFIHGNKPISHQRYIVLHDTESDADAQSVIDWWDSNGNLVAAHFIVNKDGSIWQCAPLDAIVHHAGFGDTGHNEKYGTIDESYDDKRGTTPIGDWASDYGMNSYSIGIEMVHTGGEGPYPKAQLEAIDGLIAYLDAYYGFESEIIDHKAWRSGNSDTSEEFAEHLAHYQAYRTHSDN